MGVAGRVRGGSCRCDSGGTHRSFDLFDFDFPARMRCLHRLRWDRGYNRAVGSNLALTVTPVFFDLGLLRGGRWCSWCGDRGQRRRGGRLVIRITVAGAIVVAV